MRRTLVDVIVERLREDGRARVLREAREALGLSRNQVADAIGIMPNDVYRAETHYTGSRTCPDAVGKVQAYLYGLMGVRPAGRGPEGPEPAPDDAFTYEKGDLVHVTGLEGIWRYQYHHTSPGGVVHVTVYGGPKHHSQFRAIRPEQLGRIIRKHDAGDD